MGVDLNDFDTEGYAGSLQYGLTGAIRATGQVAISSINKVLQGYPYEYRFFVSVSVTGVNGGVPVNAANFTKVVSVDSGLFDSIKNGQMWYTGTPFKVVDIEAKKTCLGTRAFGRYTSIHPILLLPFVMADFDERGVQKRNPSPPAQAAGLQKNNHRQGAYLLKFHKTVIRNRLRKIVPHMGYHMP